MRTSQSVTGAENIDKPPLDYLQPSPVRGQLEPYREKTRAGWRFLQCTDTPDELKVGLLSQVCGRGATEVEALSKNLGVAAPTHSSDLLSASVS
jgi:hypothetical protein